MPFGGAFDELFRRILQPALAEAGFDCRRADSLLHQQSVMRDVVRGIANATLVIADLSEANANVYYELGIAHGLRRPTVLISQRISDMPFDLRGYRTIEYSTDFAEIGSLAEQLRAVAKAHIAGELRFGSPVSDYATTDSLESERRAEPSHDRGGAPTGAQGYLDDAVAIENAGARIGRLGFEIGQHTEAIGDAMIARTSELEALQRSSAFQPAQTRSLLWKAADDLEEYAAKLGPLVADLDVAASELVDHGESLLAHLIEAEDVDQADLRTQAETMSELHESVTESADQMQEFRGVVRGLRGATERLDRATESADRALGRLVSSMMRVASFGERASEVLLVTLADAGASDASNT